MVVRQDDSVTSMLILTEQALSQHDVYRIVGLHDDPITAHIVIPSGTDQSTLDQVVDDLTRTDIKELGRDLDSAHPEATEAARAAQEQLDTSIALLAAAGATVTGSLVSNHPVDPTAEMASERDVDEVIVITEPHLVTDVLRRDWGTQLRRKVDRPLLHFIADTDEIIN
jgi:hypothetical protein